MGAERDFGVSPTWQSRTLRSVVGFAASVVAAVTALRSTRAGIKTRRRITISNSVRLRELRRQSALLRGLAASLTAAEALHATTGVDQLLTTRVERVAVRADLYVNLRLRRPSGELVAAGTADVGLDVLGMDLGLHGLNDSHGDQPRTGASAAPEVRRRLRHERVHHTGVELAAGEAI